MRQSNRPQPGPTGYAPPRRSEPAAPRESTRQPVATTLAGAASLPTGSSYITSDQLKATLSMSDEDYADADIDSAVLAASNSINDTCRRRFTLDPDATSIRYYRPLSRRLVEIDDCVQVAELATGQGDGSFDTIWTPDSQYNLEPFNAAADNEPYTLIRAVTGHFPAFRDRRSRTVRVTGQFGWPQVPDAITLATSLLASRLLRRVREAPFGIVMIGLEGAPSQIAQSDPDIFNMIRPYILRLVA